MHEPMSIYNAIESRIHTSLCPEYFGLNDDISDDVFREIMCAIGLKYNESNRYYHTLIHIGSCLAHSDFLYKVNNTILNEPKYDITENELHKIHLALLFHDISITTVNESCMYFTKLFKYYNIDFNYYDDISNLISETNHDDNYYNNNIFSANIIRDADLVVLGSDYFPDYFEYVQAIRYENINIDKNEYIFKRINILQSFLNKETIFRTPFMIKYKEEFARSNIAKEIELLPYIL
jgi:predicted metal-dependent HD superfamily phosphohydrolase